MRARFSAIRKGIENIFNTKKHKSTTCNPSLEFSEPHMNELPVPCERWDTWYNRQQSFYNNHLYAGIVWWLFSLGLAVYTDSLMIEYWSSPAQPAPPTDATDECTD